MLKRIADGRTHLVFEYLQEGHPAGPVDNAFRAPFVPGDRRQLTALLAGAAQALAMEWRQGRIVILGEAGMLTAQVDRGEPFGMNSPGNDNRRLALNIMRWLSRSL